MAGVGEVLTLTGWFLTPVITKLVDDLVQKSISYLGNDIAKELEDLETTLLPEIKLTIQAAQHSSPNHKAELNKWLQRLKNVYIDAEAILQKTETRTSKKKLLKRLIKLKEVAAESKKLRDLLVIAGNFYLISSSIHINKVFGRDGVRKEIIDFLLVEQGDSSSGKSYSVVAITGVEGVGKTALAQYVFNDQTIEEYFSVRMWLNFSPDLNVPEYTKEMIESVSGNKCPNLRNLYVLQKKLEELLSVPDNIMIVLDDVWYDYNDKRIGERQWDYLLAPIVSRKGKGICKIVVTSRSTLFPSALLPEKRIGLCNLELADFKSLLKCHAIDGLQISNPQMMNDSSDLIKSTVDQIAEKMNAMGKQPLEAKVVGNYLSQSDITVWQKTRDQNCVL